MLIVTTSPLLLSERDTSFEYHMEPPRHIRLAGTSAVYSTSLSLFREDFEEGAQLVTSGK